MDIRSWFDNCPRAYPLRSGKAQPAFRENVNLFFILGLNLMLAYFIMAVSKY